MKYTEGIGGEPIEQGDPSAIQHDRILSLCKTNESLSLEEYIDFIEKLRINNEINVLTPNEQKVLLESYIEKLPKNEQSENAVSHFARYTLLPERRDHTKHDIADTAYAMIPDLWRTHSHIALAWEGSMGQECQLLNPDTLLRTAGRVMRDHTLPSRAYMSTLATLEYAIGDGFVNESAYVKYLRQRIDAIQTLTIEEGAELLTLLNELSRETEDSYRTAQNASHILHELLKEFAQKTPCALLRRKAQALLTFRKKPLNIQERKKQDHTETIIIEDIDQHVSCVIPISKEYLGVYNGFGDLIYALKKEDKLSYSHSELLQPQDIVFEQINTAVIKTIETTQVANDYIMLLDVQLLDDIEKDYGFSIRDLRAEEQMWFLSYLRNVTTEQESQVQEMTKKFGLTGARTFLSCEFGEQSGNDILKIAQTFPIEIAHSIFEMYGNIVDQTLISAQELHTQFFVQQTDASLPVTDIHEQLLKRAKMLLSECAQMHNTQQQLILDRLTRYTAETTLFTSIFKVAKTINPDLDFEEVRGMSIEEKRGVELTDQEKETMQAIAYTNWFAQKPDIVDEFMHEFNAYMLNETSRFYFLKKDNAIVGFMRFDNPSHDHIHVGGLNLDKKYQNGAIGNTFLHRVVDMEAQKSILIADTFVDLPVLEMYLHDLGFIITGTNIDQNNFRCVVLERNDKVNNHYKRISAPKVFNITTQSDELLNYIEDQTESGYVLTAYRVDKQNPTIRHIGFERSATTPH